MDDKTPPARPFVRPKHIIANWKMHGALSVNAALLAAIQSGLKTMRQTQKQASVQVAVCVPFPYLAQTQAFLQDRSLAWGAQDVSNHTGGAYTGEVAASMLTEFGVQYVLVGHSERRMYHHETDALIAQKALRALEAGLTPIVCVGESRQARDAGHTEQVVGEQLQAVLNALSVIQTQNIIVAYEPVWAIGAARSASPQEAQAVHAYLRTLLAKKLASAIDHDTTQTQSEATNSSLADSIALLYGGSMKAANAAALLMQPDIDGGLIGGASLEAAEFLAICAAAP